MFTNYATKELFFKIAYLGDPPSGSTDAYFALQARLRPMLTRELKCEPLESGGTICLFEVGLGDIRGFGTRFHVYAIDACAPTEADERVLLRGVDVVVFTVSASDKVEHSAARLGQLRSLVGTATPVLVQVAGKKQGAPPEKLAKALGVPAGELMPIQAAMTRQQALSGAAPSEETGVVAGFKAAAKLALMTARDGPRDDEPRPMAGLAPGERYAELGRYRLLMPGFWKDFKVTNEGPVSLFEGTISGVHLEVTVWEGGSEEPAALVDRYAKAYRARCKEPAPLPVAGMPFDGVRLSAIEQSGLEDCCVEVLGGRVGPDLLLVRIGLMDLQHLGAKRAEALRGLCLKMVEGAILRRMNEDPSPWQGRDSAADR